MVATQGEEAQRMNKSLVLPDQEESGSETKRSTTIQSISIAMRFLDILASSERALPLGELARLAGAGRSTAHRYMQSLVKEGLVQQDPATSHYDLGAMALSIGIAALRRIDAVELAGQHMKQLAESHAMSGGVAIWTDRGPTLVRWYRSAYFSITALGLGDMLPVDNTACGLVFQSYLPKSTIDAARRIQPGHFRGETPRRADIEQIRREGWAELTSHLLSNVTGQAAPIFDAQGELSCVVTTVTDLGQLRSPDDRLVLQDVARVINRATGGQSCLSQGRG